MTREVTRKEAIKIIEHLKLIVSSEDYKEAFSIAIEALQEPERKKGRWENGEPCPICGEDRFKDLYADIWADWQPPFCPNCGADMRGKQE